MNAAYDDEDPNVFQQRLQSRTIPFTSAVLAVLVALFVAKQFLGEHGVITDVRMGAVTPGRSFTQPWRLLSYAFLHANWQHIFFNGMSLASLGAFYERLLGTGRVAVLFVLAAWGGGVVAAIGSPNAVMVGASGALWGMLGLSAALALQPGDLLPASVQQGFRRNVMVNFVLQGAVAFIPNISWQAHLGGGLVGFALMITGLLHPRGDVDSRAWRIAGALAAALAIVCIALAMVTGRPWELLSQSPFEADTLR